MCSSPARYSLQVRYHPPPTVATRHSHSRPFFSRAIAASWDVCSISHAAVSASAISEARYLVGMCFMCVFLIFLDVRHKDIFGTTHVTGTVLHYLLRQVGFDVAVRIVGRPEGGSALLVMLLLVYAVPGVHALISYAAGRLRKLDDRDGPPSTPESALGLVLSYLFMAASLCLLMDGAPAALSEAVKTVAGSGE